MSYPCGSNPDLWLSTEPEDQYAAILACHSCPFEKPCEEIGRREIHGVWGGVLRGRTGVARQPTRRVCQWRECAELFVSTNPRAKYCSQRCQGRQSRFNKVQRREQERVQAVAA